MMHDACSNYMRFFVVLHCVLLSAGDASPSTSHSVSIRDLPPGKLGKLIVLENGEVRLRIDKHLFHVNMGAPCHVSPGVVLRIKS